MWEKLKIAICVSVLVCCLAGLAGGITTGQKVKTEGWIVSRQGDSITVNTIDAGEIAVLITSYTKVHEPKGLLNVRKKQMPHGALVTRPGHSVSTAEYCEIGNRLRGVPRNAKESGAVGRHLRGPASTNDFTETVH